MDRKEEFEQAKKMTDSDFSAGWNAILSLAESGYEEAMEYVAMSYYKGDGVEMNEPLAYDWFCKIVKVNPDNGSMWKRIGDCHCCGYGVPEDHNEALKFYQKAWESGNADAGAEIGWLYSFGDIPENNDMTAAKWFQRAADKGSLRGMYFMGYFYDEGHGGLPVNEKRAAEYLRQAAAGENFAAIRYLLTRNCYGDQDEFLALRNKLFEMAKAGNDRAQEALGYAYYLGSDVDMGFGLEQDLYESQKWYELAVENGNVDALYELGRKLVDYDGDYMLDLEKGERYLIKAYEKGKHEAAYELFWFYKRKERYSEALLWGERTVENGNELLACDIATLFYEGKGTDVDYDKAAYYFQMGINRKEEMTFTTKRALLPLAKCCILSSQPSDAKYKEAYVDLKLLSDIADEEPVFARQKGEIEYWIAYMIDNGLGVQCDLEEAFRHYTKSAELGYAPSQEAMQHFKKSIFGWKRI